MYRSVIIFVFMFAASAVPDEIWSKCYGVHSGIVHCCTGIKMRTITTLEDIDECLAKRKPGLPTPFRCYLEECLGKKYGYYGDDGFDKEAFINFMENNIENNEALVAAVKEKCLNGDLSKYGPPDMCNIIKVLGCFDNQFLKECPKFSNEGQCKGSQDAIVPECVFDD